jgi:hypothetical protein
MLSLSFPSLAIAISSFSPDQSTPAVHLQNALTADLTVVFKHFLIVRSLSICLFLWCFVYGLFYSLVVNPWSAIWMLIIMFLWAILCRIVMNQLGKGIADYEDYFKARLALLTGSLLRSDIVVSVGTGMYWLEVGTANDITAVELAIVPNKD